MKRLSLVFALLLTLSSCAPKQRNEGPGVVKRGIEKKQKIAAKKGAPLQSKKVAAYKKPKILKIALDAGHGGDDPGTKAVIAPHTPEKVLTLKTALKVKEFLTRWGYKVYLTRKTDVFVPLLERVDLAEKNQCSLFVSIHYNSAPRKTASGVEIFYYKNDKDEARRKLSHSLGAAILKRMVKVAKSPSRGIHAGDFCVIRENRMPAVLVEAGFLSNPAEAKKLKNPNYLKFLSWSIAKGIEDFIHKNGPELVFSSPKAPSLKNTK